MSDGIASQPEQINVALALREELVTIGIPPRPAVLTNIEQEVRSKAPNYGNLSRIISQDVGVSASLLKISNSAFFGMRGRIRSVQDALQILGLNTVASAVAALSLRDAFAHVPNLERFWDSSARIAQISGWLATQVKCRDHRLKPEEAYTFGLFRDCGIPVLMANFSDYIDILKKANAEESLPFTAVEDAELGVNHARIGGMLANEWHLPIEFRMAIHCHHDSDAIRGSTPDQTPDIARYFIALSQLAEHLLQRMTGLNKTLEWGKLGEVCLKVLHLEARDTDRLLEAMMEHDLHLKPIC